MELFDVCDLNGRPTGEIVSRAEAHRNGILHRTAHIWIIREKDGKTEILLQKRSRNKDSFPGRFDTSSAGHIDAGDEPLESAQRELMEELGIFAKKDELIFAGTFRIDYEEVFHGSPFRDNEVAFVFVYERPVDISKLTLQEEEVEAVEWFELEQTISEIEINHNKKYCVPLDGLYTLKHFLERSLSNGRKQN